MAAKKGSRGRRSVPKKTRQGRSTNTKYGNKGSGTGGSTKSKLYRKRYRGQGK